MGIVRKWFLRILVKVNVVIFYLVSGRSQNEESESQELERRISKRHCVFLQKLFG